MNKWLAKIDPRFSGASSTEKIIFLSSWYAICNAYYYENKIYYSRNLIILHAGHYRIHYRPIWQRPGNPI